jgi:NAD(P)-dependent dehydrogenase (short-subunit alcohol dehydrogenase family)
MISFPKGWSMKEFQLEGRMAIVTGAGRGIGKAIALTLAEAGAHIIAAARTGEEIEETAAEVRKMGRTCLPIPTDVTKAGDVARMVDEAILQFGRIDILINQAGRGGGRKPLVPLPGYAPPGSKDKPDFFTPLSEEMWHSVLDTNLTSMFLCARAVGPHMIRQKKGKIVNMSSFVGAKGFPHQSAYSTSKAAVSMFTRCLALEWARYKINVNAMGPGYVRTAMTEPVLQNEKTRETLLNSVPLRRFCEPREVGLLALYLASEASDYLTGQTIYLDGGLLA